MARHFPQPREVWQRRDGQLARVGERVRTYFGPARYRVYMIDALGGGDIVGYLVDGDGFISAPSKMEGDLVTRVQGADK